MSSSAALKVLFALAVIWASYETSVALEYEISEQGSSTEETESTEAPTTQITTEDERQATTAGNKEDFSDEPVTAEGDPGAEGIQEIHPSDVTSQETPLHDFTSKYSHTADVISQSTQTSRNNAVERQKERVAVEDLSEKADQEVRPAIPYNPPQGLQMPNESERNETVNGSEEKGVESEEQEFSVEDVKTLSPPTFSGFIYDFDSTAEGNLQDIAGQESKIVNNLYLNFEPKKYRRKKNEIKTQRQPAVQITSYLADSETAIPMTESDILSDARNKTRGADMISAFFIAPEDEVNEIDKTKYAGRPIVVSNLNEDLVRNERYTGREATKSLTNDILAPIQAALSLSHEADGPVIEKQILQKEPVYKTFIEIQKSIPYEIKEVEEPKEQIGVNEELGHQGQNGVEIHHSVGDVQQPQVVSNELPSYTGTPVRSPVSFYYRYPMYYLPNSYIGNYIMRHSHENTGYQHQQAPVKPILPVQYVLARYQPQVYSTFLLGHPYYVPTDVSGQHDPYDGTTDQNGLQAEQRPQYAHSHYPPFRPSHPVYASQYPPYTYKVLSTMKSRSGSTRTARSKQLCIEYGGFKPPMVPSVQIDDEELSEPVKDKTEADDKAAER
ncbi:hypothetical protein GE061_009260 [Apolygus lucorum]|uniref:DUF4794 domain-containing protein n=1 Tax=Apolygus lucorum TaxID=248454 RepID=A0A8S9Y004_APOLU|nr:hypothetical protein GE061_009260 [Apolygus lucorum]